MLPRKVEQVEPALRESIRRVFEGADPWPLFISGGVGTGKSCATLCAIDRVIGSRKYIVAADFVDQAMKAAKGDLWSGEYRVTDTQFWIGWEAYAVTCVDELGARGKAPDWHYEIVKKAMDRRWGRPCIWISNLSLDQLYDVYDERIVSRLGEGTVLETTGPDRRVGR